MPKNENLIKRRKEMNMTQEEVAKRAGILREYYNLIENGRKTPSLRVAKKIARALMSGVDALFYDV